MGIPGYSDTILIVDDEPDSLRMLVTAFESAHLSVLVASSGKAALELLGRILPNLIIMDGVMPGLDGFETAMRIKQNPVHAHIPIIFLTGLTESEHVIEAFEVGGVDYVRKPVNLAELLARVRLHMAQGRAAHASAASLDATGRLMLATDARGAFLWCTPRAEQAITRVAPAWRREHAALPPEMNSPVARLLAKGDIAGASVRIERPGGALELVVIAHYRENEVLIRLNELDPDQDMSRLRDRMQLTDRQAEILLWVSYGKSSSDISDVLDISPRTVQKHLERIYEKLGVETRSAAAAIAIKAMQE
jgi:DNA-binding NarL/FixJ family response regulator